ncbi:MAG: HAD family hydrolase [Xanthomonadaceae bacterium]|nr:HAD family hydrolase [Xanthomonadaceae bacterium]
MNLPPRPGVFMPSGGRPEPVTAGPHKALFLDRDGVINVDRGYVHTAGQTQWMPGIFELCGAARDAGYALIVVTNQAGIARGYYTEAQFEDYTRWLHGQFAERGVPLLATYYCPHHPVAGTGAYHVQCDCRKPRPGMLLAAAKDFDLPLGECVLIGDMPSDLQAAVAAGVGTARLLGDLPPHPADLFAGLAPPDNPAP